MGIPIVSRLAAAKRVALDTVYPPRCVECGRFDTWLCEGCAARMVRPGGNVCPSCSAPWEDVQNCPRCQSWPPALDRCRAAYTMEGPARTVVHGLKYRYQRDLAAVMARAMRGLREREPFDVAYP